MDNRLWARTLLACYSRLPRAMSNVDKTVEAKIWDCFKGGGDALKELTQLSVIMLRKKSFELAKAAVDEVMEAYEKDRFSTLRRKYIEATTFRQISEATATSIRTVFRRHNEELDRFSKEMDKKGYDTEFCEKEWGRIPLFLREKTIQAHGAAVADEPHISVYFGEVLREQHSSKRIEDKPALRC